MAAPHSAMGSKGRTNGPSRDRRSSLRSRSFSPSRPGPRQNNSKRRPITNFTDIPLRERDSNIMHLENEYIRSLQQQIYLLELENNYIRQQAAKVMEKQPVMISEASQAVQRMKAMKSEIDALNLEIFRKQAHIEILDQKLNQTNEHVKQVTFNFDKEKDDLTRQCVTLRGERELALREVLQKDAQLEELRNDLARTKSSLSAAEIQLDLLRAKFEDESNRSNDFEKALLEKSAELLNLNTMLRQMDAQYRQELSRHRNMGSPTFEKKVDHLHQRLGESFLQSEKDRYIRAKQAEDFAALVQENSNLTKELEYLRKVAEETRSTLERLEVRHATELAELEALRHHQRDLTYQNALLRDEAQVEKNKVDLIQKQLEQQEKVYDSFLIQHNPRPHLVATEELEQLRKDRQYLIEHIHNMENEINRQGQKIDELEFRSISKQPTTTLASPSTLNSNSIGPQTSHSSRLYIQGHSTNSQPMAIRTPTSSSPKNSKTIQIENPPQAPKGRTSSMSGIKPNSPKPNPDSVQNYQRRLSSPGPSTSDKPHSPSLMQPNFNK